MTFAGLVGRISRLGFLSSGASRLFGPYFQNFASHAFSLGMEAAAFEGLHRAFSPFGTHESFRQSCTAHFINFSTFRLVGALGGSSSSLAQHFTQSFAMVAGHQVAGVLGVEEKARGSFSEQMLLASISTAQIQVGSMLGAAVTGHRLASLERHWEHLSTLTRIPFAENFKLQHSFAAQSTDFTSELQAWNSRIQGLPGEASVSQELSNGVRLRWGNFPGGSSKGTLVELGQAPIRELTPFLTALREHHEGPLRFVNPPDLPERLLIWGNREIGKRQVFIDRIFEIYSQLKGGGSADAYQSQLRDLHHEVETCVELFAHQRKIWEWLALQSEDHPRLDRCSLGLVVQHHFLNFALGVSSMLDLVITNLRMGRELDAEDMEILSRVCRPSTPDLIHEAAYLSEDLLRHTGQLSSDCVGILTSPETKHLCFRDAETANIFRSAIYHVIMHAAPHLDPTRKLTLDFHLDRLEDGSLQIRNALHYSEMDSELIPFIPHEFETASEILERAGWGELTVSLKQEGELELAFRVPRRAFESAEI